MEGWLDTNREERSGFNATVVNESIKFALSGFARDLLPEEITEDHLVRWILNFVNISGEERQENYNMNYNNKGKERILAQLVEDTLEYTVKFYYASLMHIGRVWKVSLLAINDIEIALQFDNLRQTADTNIEMLQRQTGREIHPGQLEEAYAYLLTAAWDKHRLTYTKALQWWTTWKQEVERVLHAIDEANEHYLQERNAWERDPQSAFFEVLFPLSRASYERQELVYMLRREGVEVMAVKHPDTGTLVLSQLLNMPKEEIERKGNMLAEYSRAKEIELEFLRRERLTPLMMQAERELLRLFLDNNPFERYAKLGAVPDEYLKELFNKCRLPDGTYFYHAQHWLDSLEPEIEYYYQDLPYKELSSTPDIVPFARSADSIIRRNWVLNRTFGMLTSNELLQRYVEGNWIKPIVFAATRGKKKDGWTFEHIVSLITNTLSYLNGIGYELKVPADNRLRNLWDKLSKDGYIYEW